MPDQLDTYISEHADRWTAELRELCAIPSEATDADALRGAAAWCEQRLHAAGCDARQVSLDGAPPLVVGETGSGARTLIGVQHYDVQPAVP
ncbi:MAG: peptidase M20, partial [Actinobacteria bacterium]|nr:peptidase M20 [Actinomycetota bacterium]